MFAFQQKRYTAAAGKVKVPDVWRVWLRLPTCTDTPELPLLAVPHERPTFGCWPICTREPTHCTCTHGAGGVMGHAGMQRGEGGSWYRLRSGTVADSLA